jgi:hypothetical protein
MTALMLAALSVGAIACGSENASSNDDAEIGDAWIHSPVKRGNSMLKEALGRRSFCSSPGPVDYSRPLSRLPDIRKIPSSGKLPFAPDRLKIYSSTASPVLTDGGLFGYTFFDSQFKGTLRLGWDVGAKLHAISDHGRLMEELDRGHIKVNKVSNVDPPTLSLNVPAKVGFYRFDVQLTDNNSRILGEFSEYLRVVPLRVGVRLGINGRRFGAGQVVVTRVENTGTSQVTYGAAYRVERSTRDGWRGVPELNRRPFPAYQGILPAGGAGRCGGFKVTPNFQPGSYRITRDVGVASSAGAMRSREVAATFSISN